MFTNGQAAPSKSDLHQIVRKAVLYPIALLLLMMILLTGQIFRQRATALQTDHADRVIAKLHHVNRIFIDLETGFRGYLLSGDEVFLQPYHQGIGAIHSEMDALEELVETAPDQAERVQKLKEGLGRWEDYARTLISQRRTVRASAYADYQGKDRMDEIRRELEAAVKKEEGTRFSEATRWQNTLRQTLSIILALFVVAGVFFAFFIRKKLRLVAELYGRSLEDNRREKEQYRAVFDGVRDHGIMLMDTAGKVERWNTAAEKITGYSSAEVVGKDADFMRSSDQPRTLPNLLREAQEEGRSEVEGWRLRKNGSRFWIDVVVTALYDARGALRGFSSVFRDFSGRKRVEEERSFLLRKLQEAVSSRDEFLSLASHELRTPLTSLSLQLQTARRQYLRNNPDLDPVPLPRRVFDSFSRQTDRLAALVERMLELTRVHAGQLEVNFKEVNLTELAQRVVNHLGDQLEENRCTVNLQGPAELKGHWDEFRLEQVLVNLLSNAMKHAPGKPIEVTTEAVGEDRARLTVRDQGPGIPKEYQPRIFQKFGKVVSSSDSGGMGLGLYISQQIAQAHGGELRLSSEPGAGASFTLELPLQ